MMRKKIDGKSLAFFLIYTFVLGGLGALLAGGFNLEALNAPPLALPAWLFPVVWTILYAAMAVAAYLLFVSRDIDRGAPLRLYLLQMVINALWPLFFFRLEWRLFAFLWLLLLLVLVILMMAAARPISPAAFWLLVPYLVWLFFAAYLNFGYYWLNR